MLWTVGEVQYPWMSWTVRDGSISRTLYADMEKLMYSEDIENTTSTTSQGLYEVKMMPSGFANAPTIFVNLIENVWKGL